MKGKLVLLLFALPFFGVGVLMLYTISSNVYDAWRMKSWESTEAQLIKGGYETQSGDDSDTYEAYAEYSYRFLGGDYTNNRVAIAGGADNIGDYQVDRGRRLSGALRRGAPIQIYVSPDNPQNSVIDRNLRWGLIGFRSIFLFAFGGIGLGAIYLVFRAPKQKDLSDPEYMERPWLANDAWQTATIKSNSKVTMYVTWGFAVVWNLISAPLPFVIYAEFVEKDNYLALIGLLFPVVGIGLLTMALRRTLEWRRFGPAPVTLDPYPGAIGGHAGGTIDINLSYDPEARFQLTLTNAYSYVSGSGKNRSRGERAKWQDSQWLRAAPAGTGTRLSFRFDVPEALIESDAEKTGDSYHIWRLNVKADLPGIDVDRDYEIPVYATGEKSRHLPEHMIRVTHDDNEQVHDQAVQAKIKKNHGVYGTELYYPVGRNMSSALGGVIIGSIFAGSGWFLMFPEGHLIFGSVFGIVGSLIAVGALYSMLNSLRVIRDAGRIRTERRILGIPLMRREMLREEFRRFSKKSSTRTQSGSKHTLYFSIIAEGVRGQKIVVGEGFKGGGEADAAIRLIAREMGLHSRAAQVDTIRPAGPNMLTDQN